MEKKREGVQHTTLHGSRDRVLGEHLMVPLGGSCLLLCVTPSTWWDSVAWWASEGQGLGQADGFSHPLWTASPAGPRKGKTDFWVTMCNAVKVSLTLVQAE